MKQTLALYNTPYCDCISLEQQIDYNGNTCDRKPEYVRLTEWVEVEFPELPKDEVVNKQVASIDSLIEEIKSDAMKKVGELQKRKQEILALTVQS